MSFGKIRRPWVGGWLIGLTCFGLVSGANQNDEPKDTEIGEQTSPPMVERVGGKARWEVRERDGKFYAGPMSVTTRLPIVYPRPTPPGAIEIKRYPVVRRAIVSGDGPAQDGGNRGFFPLFRHISARDIPMTAPVEMEYPDLKAPGDGARRPAQGWTMAFLYESDADGPTGSYEAGVVVEDAPPIVVLAIGVRGSSAVGALQAEVDRLDAWLSESPVWERAPGSVRVLQYNGPMMPSGNRWVEVQLPIRPVNATPGSDINRNR